MCKSVLPLSRMCNVASMLMFLFVFDQTSRADSGKTPDPRDCVCTFVRTVPKDIFTARVVETSRGFEYEVVEVLTHGVPQRQVVGEAISGAETYHGSRGTSESFLIYEGPTRDTFYVVSIPSLDLEKAYIQTLSTLGLQDEFYSTICVTEFSLSQLKVFVEALADGEGTCPALASKYLGIPKPPAESGDNFLQCGGGAPPGWLIAILGILGVLAARASRRRVL